MGRFHEKRSYTLGERNSYSRRQRLRRGRTRARKQRHKGDESLLKLAAKVRPFSRRLDALCDAMRAAEGSVPLPPWPPEFLVQPGDHRLPLRITHSPGERIGPDVVDAARDLIADPRWTRTLPADFLSRLREIAHAGDELGRAHDARERSSGVPAVRRRWDRFLQAKRKLYAAAGRTPAESPAGVLAKLMIAAHDVAVFAACDFADEGEAEFVLASAVCDALALAGGRQEDRARLAEIRNGLGLAEP